MSPLKPSVRPLSFEEIETVAAGFNDDLQRAADRAKLRHRSAMRNDCDSARAAAALKGIEYIGNFVDALKRRAASRIGFPARSRPIHLIKKRGGAS